MDVSELKCWIAVLVFVIVGKHSDSQSECAYDDYWYYASKAHIEFAQQKYTEALANYRKAFETVEVPYGTDLNAAFITAITVESDSLAYDYAARMMKCGIPLEYFSNFEEYDWYEKLKQDYPVARKYYQANFDYNLRDTILELRVKDSLFNVKYHNFRKGLSEMRLEELIEGVQSIENDFIEIVRKFGFPSHQNLGYYFDGSKIDRYPITIILHHLYQNGSSIFKEQLSAIVCDGKIRPTDQALLSRIQGFSKGAGIEQELRIKYNRIKSSP